MNKVLVCITLQENSKRLMAKGAELTKEAGGELHVLHIRQGDSIFETPNSSQLFEELFIYGSELGGQVHFLCSNDVPMTISRFLTENGITHLILGATNQDLPCTTITNIVDKWKCNEEKDGQDD